MAINVIHDGGSTAFDLMVFPEQNPINQAYIKNQFDVYGSSLTNINNKFISQAKDLYDRVNDSSVIKAAKAALRSVSNVYQPNEIYHITNVEDLMACKPINQRFIMAMPDIRKLYFKQLIDGYSDTYIDLEPNKIGFDHYDYRRVMDGIVDEDEDGIWKCTNIDEELLPGDKELTFNEKTDVLLSWETVKMALAGKIDPTNPLGGKL